MNRWYVAGPLVSPNGMTLHLYDPYQVRKVVNSSDSGSMRMQWNAWRMSSFVKTRACRSRAKVSSIKGNGYWSLRVKSLSLRKLIQNRNDPLGFLTKRIGAANGALLASMTLLDGISQRYAFSGCWRGGVHEEIVGVLLKYGGNHTSKLPSHFSSAPRTSP
jgi:hypothetical protein